MSTADQADATTADNTAALRFGITVVNLCNEAAEPKPLSAVYSAE